MEPEHQGVWPEASERRIDSQNIDLLLGLKVKTCRSGS